MRFSCRSRSERIFFAIEESTFALEDRAVELRAILGLERSIVALCEVFLVDLVPFLALSFCFANFNKALTNWSFRIECQPSTPFFLACWARSLDFCDFSEAAVIKVHSPRDICLPIGKRVD